MVLWNHTIDPEGDVILTLKHANSKFAIWDEVATSAQDQDTPASEPVTFRVSSHHLKLASPVLKAALTGGWAESTVTEDGYCRLDVEDSDPEALRIALAVIHGRNHQVPHTITLEILCKVAVLVDYYQCHEAFDFCNKIWVDELRKSLPQTYGRDLILWLCVSWVFQVKDLLQATMNIAVERSYEKMRLLQLPTPESLTGMRRWMSCEDIY